MSMSTAKPISKRPKKSCSTPRCAAPAFAARRRRCWSTAPGPTACSRRWSRLLLDARLRSARRRRRRKRSIARVKLGGGGGLVDRISRRDHRGETGGRRAGRDRPYRDLRLASHRLHRHRKRRKSRKIPARGGFGHRDPQRLDPIRRWRRIRLRRGNRHRHRADACARAGRRGAAHLVQICRAWRRDRRGREICRHSARGMRIGLFGGSFNPPHAGHALVCAIALAPAGPRSRSG